MTNGNPPKKIHISLEILDGIALYVPRVYKAIRLRYGSPKVRLDTKPPLWLFGFNGWKHDYMKSWFPDKDVRLVHPMMISQLEFDARWKWRILEDPRARVMMWQYKSLPTLKDWCDKWDIPFHYVEDGFLRSLDLGAKRTSPLSLAFDMEAMYFDGTRPSDLEKLLQTSEDLDNPGLIARAKTAMDLLMTSKLSKYNLGTPISPTELYGEPDGRRRVLVIGQVERDASIVYGCNIPFTNNDLVWLARRENPKAHIIYKPHPETVHGTDKTSGSTHEVSGAAQILTRDVALADAFQTIDHVYTITSLAGFEAAVRGIPVTCTGSPFYSGWGFTDDRQPNSRRTRQLSVAQVFLGAYLLYPEYIDPVMKRRISFEEALQILRFMKEHQPKPDTGESRG